MKFKILAGILGIPVDTLTERDKAYQLQKAQKDARKLRRWLAVVGLLLLLALGAGAIAYEKKSEAETAQAEAIRQRNSAEQQKTEADAAKGDAIRQKQTAEEERDRAKQILADPTFFKQRT